MREQDIKKHEESVRLQRQGTRDALAEWANIFEWQIYHTGTFRREMSYRDTIKTKRAFRRFVDVLKHDYGKKSIEYFMVVERHKDGNFTHVHDLMNGLDGLTYNQIREVWESKFGRASVSGYDPAKGANYYLTKYVLKDVCDWDIKIDLRKPAVMKFKESQFPEYERNSRGVLVRKG